MTLAQQRRLYFPAWNAAWRQNWRKDRGTAVLLVAPRNPDLAAEIDRMARDLAARRQATTSDRDVRYACHLRALGATTPSQDLRNSDIDRVLCLFRLLEDPDDIDAVIAWDDPALDARRRLEYGVSHTGFPEAYVRTVSSSKFGTSEWRNLTDAQLRLLIITLRERARARARKAEPAADSEAANNEPF